MKEASNPCCCGRAARAARLTVPLNAVVRIAASRNPMGGIGVGSVSSPDREAAVRIDSRLSGR